MNIKNPGMQHRQTVIEVLFRFAYHKAKKGKINGIINFFIYFPQDPLKSIIYGEPVVVSMRYEDEGG